LPSRLLTKEIFSPSGDQSVVAAFGQLALSAPVGVHDVELGEIIEDVG
jgi:hypothetical protein